MNMPRKPADHVKESAQDRSKPNCFAYYTSRSGQPGCHALDDVYCLKDKKKPCPFRKTRRDAAQSRQNALLRLSNLGR
jgi:hypothetical protein